MFMDSSYYPDYPDLLWYLFLQFPDLPSKTPKVWEIFKRYAPRVPFDFMAYGTPPLVRPEKGFLICENDGNPEQQTDGSYIQPLAIKWYGLTPINAGYILVASDLCKMAGLPAGGELLEAVLLHELVHYCRQGRGIEKDQDTIDERVPYAFEQEAYGKVIRRDWKTCMDLRYFKTP